jgi:hypothetical protein
MYAACNGGHLFVRDLRAPRALAISGSRSARVDDDCRDDG